LRLKPPGKNQPAGPAPAGHFRQPADHGFCQSENKQNNIISLHRTTSAKTRATVRQQADQLHIIHHSQMLKVHELAPFVGLGSAKCYRQF
jgi:hypothetical protein